jgi:Fic family protein
MSIETGILERLYDLDRGTTEALVTHGFVEELVSRSSTDVEPARLIDMLRDQEAAIQLVMDCIANRRPLSISLIHELHVILTEHQDTTSAVDQFGNRRDIPLLKGQFKQLPNNPVRPDGQTHEYCPPVQVASEMDNLIEWADECQKEDPIIVAAWLHHRFTQIHPYQDGNGRVARALTTLVLLKAELLPLVIDRDLRVEYISALEGADGGDLTRLATLFARLERAGIMQALSVDADAEISHQKSLSEAVLESLEQRFAQRKVKKFAVLRAVNALALALRTRSRRLLEVYYSRLGQSAAELSQPDIHITDGGPDWNNAHWYRADVIECERASGKFVNFSEDHYFVKASIRIDQERLVFVTSFHHIGRELTGIMEATAFARLESFEDPEDRAFVSRDFFPCSLAPFVFTNATQEEAISEAFERWLDAALAVALKEYGDRI